MEPITRKSYQWVILALLWLLYGSFGLVARSISPLITPILRDLSMSYSQMGFILGSWQLTYIVVAIFAGTIIDKWGIRRSLFIGTVIVGLSAILYYLPKGFGSFLPIVALLGVGGPLISVGGPKAIALWFQGASRRKAMGIYTTGTWIGTLTGMSATNSLIMPLTGYSWRLTFVLYGVVTLVIGTLWLLLGKEIRATRETDSPSMLKVIGKLITIGNVRIALLAGLLTFAVMHGFTNWLPKILETSGLSPAMAGFAASIPIFVGTISVFFSGAVPSHHRSRVIAVLALLLIAALLLSLTSSTFLRIVALVLFGIAAFPSFPLLILVLMETPEVDSKYMGSAGGMFFCVAEIGGFGGSLIMGVLVDVTGAFLSGTIFLVLLSLVIFAIMFLLKSPAERV